MNGRGLLSGVAAGVIALAALGGCGGSSAPKKADAAADLQAAQDALIKAGDLPDFTAHTKQKNDAADKATGRDIARCMHVARRARGRVARLQVRR